MNASDLGTAVLNPTPLNPAISNAGVAGQPLSFVNWFRSAAPYIHAFRGKTFVIAFGGNVLNLPKVLESITHDINVLNSLGIKIVIVFGARPQVDDECQKLNIVSKRHLDIRITDDLSLLAVKRAVGIARMDIEAAFSKDLPNTPMADSDIDLVSGNFVTAQPLGVRGGVDFMHTGLVRKVDAATIHNILDRGDMVLLPPFGYSPTGEAFNLSMEDVAKSAAIALAADKLIFLSDQEGFLDSQINPPQLVRSATTLEMQNLLSASVSANKKNAGQTMTELERYAQNAVSACQQGVPRAHLISFLQDGATLLELFSHEGVGTMISQAAIEIIRPAQIKDLSSIVKLIEPLEQNGTLIKRGRKVIEREIASFYVVEHDKRIVGCAAMHKFEEERSAEIACVAIAAGYQDKKFGEKLLQHVIRIAKSSNYQQLFALTTRSAHWFIEHGFVPHEVKDLPNKRQETYNHERKSQVLIYQL